MGIYPTDIFRMWGSRMSQNRSTGLLERNSGFLDIYPDKLIITGPDERQDRFLAGDIMYGLTGHEPPP